jgi:enamine deaminase RidA (YjgF/YER057c/UK114 family)
MGMSERRRISTGSAYEAKWGYSRAVVDGDFVFMSGTTGFDYATMTISDDAAEQTHQCFRTIAKVLQDAGFSLNDIVQARYYVPNPADWESCGAALGEILRDVKPAATVLICALIDARMKIEIEVVAKRRQAP